MSSLEYYNNFFAMLTAVAGNSSFIKSLGIDYHEMSGRHPVNKGVTFSGKCDGGHFHWMNDHGTGDSYKMGWQVRGTNGLCQTFAIIGYLGLSEHFKPGSYLNNAIYALKFLQGHTEELSWYWNDVCSQTVSIYFPYCKLNQHEIAQDIQCLLENEAMLHYIITHETTYGPDMWGHNTSYAPITCTKIPSLPTSKTKKTKKKAVSKPLPDTMTMTEDGYLCTVCEKVYKRRPWAAKHKH